ncbi:MAG TPA: protease modulator HflC [Stellaceae bacterium]|nr:protease modulator HflC [Stellaceae bacterium]
MTRNLMIGIGVGIVALLIVLANSLYVVDQTKQALVLYFGEPIRVVRTPGLKLKVPFIQNVVLYDNRVQGFDAPSEEVIAADQKRLVVDTYAQYKIVDPLQFYRSVGSDTIVRARLGATMSGSLRRSLGNIILATLLSDQRAKIMTEIRNDVKAQAVAFGIDVIDVRIKRADLPPENSQAIYARMQSEREREAKEFRAQGAELAQGIRARAERDRTVLLAEAQRNAQILRGQGDGESVKIYADAFGQDKDFFAFYRSMQAYQTGLPGSGTTMVLSPNSEFFRYFRSMTGAPPKTGTP